MTETKQTAHTTRFWNRKRLALTLATFAVALVAMSSCRGTDDAGGGSVGANVAATNTGGAAPAPAGKDATAYATEALPTTVLETPLRDLDGKTFRLADYAGKVVVLDLWATWCGPCRVEVPHLIELSKEFGARGVEVIGLSTEDPEEATEAVREFAREFKINYKLGWGREIFLPLLRGSQPVIPQTFVITRDGRLYKHFAGFNPATGPAKLRQAVEDVAGAGGVGSP